MATAACDSAGQRLPSTRPIDCRWDRSCGLHFSNGKRPTPNDYTWSSAKGIVFSEVPASRRTYAIREVGRKAAGSPTISRAPTSAVDDAHRGNMGFLGGQEQVQLRTTISKLETEKKSLAADLTTLRKLYEQAQAQMKKHDLTLDSMRREEETLQKKIADMEARMSAEQSKQHYVLATVEDQHSRELRGLESTWSQRLETLREQADPSRKENEMVLAGVRREALNDAKSQVRAEREAQDREKTMELESEYQKRVADLESRNDEKMERIDQQVRRNEKIRIKLESLADQFRSRQERGKVDRADYIVYRNVHSMLRDSIAGLHDRVALIRANAFKENQTWRDAAETFQKSPVLALFHQMAKYKDIKLAILEHLENRASNADAVVREMRAITNQLMESDRVFAGSSHHSRSLTRYLHFGKEQGLVEGLAFVHQYLHLDPLRVTMDRLFARGTQILKERGRGHEFADVMQRHKEVKLLFEVSSAAANVAALNALLLDSPVEKTVYLRTSEQRRQFGQLNMSYLTMREEARLGGSQVEDQSELQKRYRDMAQEVRHSLAYFETLVRQGALLQQKLGILRAKEPELDSEIRTMIQSCEFEGDAALTRLLFLKKPVSLGERLRVALRSDSAGLVGRPSLGSRPEARTTKRNRAKFRAKIGALPREQLDVVQHELMTNLDGLKKRKEALSNQASASKWTKDTTDTDISKIIERLDEVQALREQHFTSIGKTGGDAHASHPSPAVDSSQPASTSIGRSRRGRLSTASGSWLNFKPTKSRQAYHTASPFDLKQLNDSPHTDCDDLESSALDFSLVGVSSLTLENVERTSSSFLGIPPEPQSLCASRQAKYQYNTTLSSTASESSYAPNSSSEDVSGHAQGSSSFEETNDHEQSKMNDSNSDDDPAEPQTELIYQIPAADFRTAVMASPNTNTAFWSHKMYKGREGKHPMVFYCHNFEVAERQAKLFLDEPVLGFDLEWEPYSKTKASIKQNISLIQIAAEDKVLLCHVACFAGSTAVELLPPSLRKLLESSDVIKAGVNISGDVRRVKEYLGVEMKGVFELSHLYRIVKFSSELGKVNFSLVSLAAQVQDVLLLPLKKDENRVSAWARKLNTQQADYAASDAYAGFRLFHELDNQRKTMKPTPPRPAFFETNQPLVLGDGTQVYRTRQRTKVKPVKVGTIAEDTDEESEEFFDAVEDLNPDELTTPYCPDTSLAGTEVAYPSLPPVLDFARNAPAVGEETEGLYATEGSVSKSPSPSTSHPSTSGIISTKSVRPDTPETQAAEAWAEAFRLSCSSDYKLVARPCELRAYHLWHEQRLSVSDVASLMKDPPLTVTTVASYVMQSVKDENLPFDDERLRREVLSEIPKSVHGRYYKVLERMKVMKGV